ncbi:hypothetical protein HQ560_19195 [bacterium]|nr:hypothetical protein [bacterium]
MAVALVCLAALARADEVVLKNGKVVTGAIIVRMDDAVLIRTADGHVVRCKTSAIQEIRKPGAAKPKPPPKPPPARPLDPATSIVVRRNQPALLGSIGAQFGDMLVLRTPDGAIVRCPRADVVEITTPAKARQAYAAKRKAIGENDLTGQCDLALWCAERALLPEARDSFRRACALADSVPPPVKPVAKIIDEWEQKQLDLIRQHVAAGHLTPATAALDALGACSAPAREKSRQNVQDEVGAARKAGGSKEGILVRVRVPSTHGAHYQLRVFNARKGPTSDSPGAITNQSANGPSMIARGKPYGRVRGTYRLRLTLLAAGKREEVNATFEASGDGDVWVTVRAAPPAADAPQFRIDVTEQ